LYEQSVTRAWEEIQKAIILDPGEGSSEVLERGNEIQAIGLFRREQGVLHTQLVFSLRA
jgi:hypothetical protein